jgi:hypothetical protein
MIEEICYSIARACSHRILRDICLGSDTLYGRYDTRREYAWVHLRPLHIHQEYRELHEARRRKISIFIDPEPWTITEIAEVDGEFDIWIFCFSVVDFFYEVFFEWDIFLVISIGFCLTFEKGIDKSISILAYTEYIFFISESVGEHVSETDSESETDESDDARRENMAIHRNILFL